MKLATLCYIRNDDEVLFLYRDLTKDDLNEGYHIGVGGKKGNEESLEECLRRETLKETGFTLGAIKTEGCLLVQNYNGEDWVVAVYSSDDYSGVLTQSNEGTLEWVAQDEISMLNILEGDKLFLPYLFTDTFFVASLDYEVVDDRREYVSGEIELFLP